MLNDSGAEMFGAGIGGGGGDFGLRDLRFWVFRV